MWDFGRNGSLQHLSAYVLPVKDTGVHPLHDLYSRVLSAGCIQDVKFLIGGGRNCPFMIHLLEQIFA